MRDQVDNSKGRKALSVDVRADIREHWLSEENSVLLATKHAKTEQPRALTASKVELYRTDPNKHKYSYSSLIKYGGTGKDAIMPELRKPKGETDICN